MSTVSKSLRTSVEQTNLSRTLEEELPRFSKRETILTMAGVLLVMLLAALDQTIVSTAMPRIIADFNGLDRYTWVTTAYLLTTTIMVPIYGKLSDMFSRKSVFLVGVVLFLIGSAASGLAQDMNQLIAFRAFQGLGAAALMPIAIAVVGDLFTPRERGKWQGLIGAVFGLASLLGPGTGGWITDNMSWRWVFYVNLPVGIAALLVLIFLMPTLRGKTQRVRIDYLGAILLATATVPLMLGFTWAGSQYDWNSPQILALFSGSAVTFVLFFVYEGFLEKRNAQPIIAPSLFKSSVFCISIAITMIVGVALFGSVYFLPLFAQGVLGLSASNSGLLLTPMMLSLIGGSVLSGQLVSRFGKYKWVVIVGAVIGTIGALLLLGLNVNSSPNDLWIAMVVLGLGTGFGIAIYTVIVQNALPTRIGEATGSLIFFRQIAATIALSAMGSVLTSVYGPAFRNAVPDQVKQFATLVQKTRHIDILNIFSNPNILLSPDIRAQMTQQFHQIPNGMQIYAQLLQAVKVGLAQGLHDTFIISATAMALGLVIVFFLKELPLRGRGPSKADKGAEEQGLEEAEEMVNPMMTH